jgi:hypothetical protein
MHPQLAFAWEPGTEPAPTPIITAALDLHQRGIWPVQVQYRAKAPTVKDWPQQRLAANDIPLAFAGRCNLGAILGEPSTHLVDIDLDWPEAAALAPQLLPQSWQFGRRDNGGAFLLTHILLHCPGIETVKYRAPAALAGGTEKNRTIIEIRSTGAQTVMPPSVHPSGAVLEWQHAPGTLPLAQVDSATLQQTVSRLAGAALLVRHWVSFEGARHDLAAALAGACHHAGWAQAEIETLLVALIRVADDPEKRDRAGAVVDTLKNAAAGQAVTGFPRLAELLGTDLADCLQEWWQLGTSVANAGLTFGGVPLADVPVTDNNPRVTDNVFAAVTDNAAAPMPGLTFGGQPLEALPLEWPELLPFESAEYAGDVRDYPTAALGPILGPAAEALAYRQQVPIALAAQSILAAAATVVQSRFDAACDGRRVPLSLFLALVAKPGERKTTTDRVAFRLLLVRLREAETVYQVSLEAWHTMRGDKASKDSAGPKPRKQQWLLTNSTTEGLLKSLDTHWPAVTLANADAATWLAGHSMREGRESATAATFSDLWSGAYTATARASLDAPTSMHNRRLSLSLMLQPNLAAMLFDNPTLFGQGFLSRCLPAFPGSLIGHRPYRRTTPDPRLDAFDNALDKLLALEVPMNLTTGDLNPHPLPLTDAALACWIPEHDRLESALAGDYADIAEVANKAPEQILRLAGIQTAIESSPAIGPEHIERAAVLVQWHLEEWLTLSVRLVEHRREVALPKVLLDWLEQRRATTGQDLFALTEIYKSGPRAFRGQTQTARDMCQVLVNRGYLRTEGKQYRLRPLDT